MTWQPTTVTTIDGRQVLSDSTEWMLCCEAVYTLGKPEGGTREKWLDDVEKRRGVAGRRSLEDEMDRVEPAYLLAFGDRDRRRAYLDVVERYRGLPTRKWLEQRIVALWEARKAGK
jgi:hypothetical protein